MRYTKFTLSKYKGVSQIELDLSKKPEINIFTLVGLNESGKTSILEAIHLFKHGIDKDKVHTLIPKSEQFSFTGEIYVEAELKLGGDDKFIVNEIKDYLKSRHGFIVSDVNNTLMVRRSYFLKDSIPVEGDGWSKIQWVMDISGGTTRTKEEKKLRSWKNEYWLDTMKMLKKMYGKKLPAILYYSDFLFEFPEKIYLEEVDGEGAEQMRYRDVVQDILTSIRPELTLKNSLINRINNKHEKSYNQALKQLLLKIEKTLNEKILTKWDAIFNSDLKKKIQVVCGVDNNQNGEPKHYIEIKIQQSSAEYSIKNDMSLGFRWFFSFLMFTTFRVSRKDDPGETLFLLDEPASNLHQRSQQKLLESLKEIVSSCRLIYSTHSHHLINPEWLAGTHIVKNIAIDYNNPEDTNTKNTNITATLYKNFVADYPNEEDHFKPILDALEYVPSKLEIATPMVFTEGKNDYYTFKYFLETVLENNQYDLVFYPGSGATKCDKLFRSWVALGVSFVALFDGDEAGVKQQKRYIELIGVDIKDKIFTLKDIDKNWCGLETEDLFSTHKERVRIIQMEFPDHVENNDFDKSKFNTAIQSLYINKKEVALNQKTIENFKKALEFLHNKIINQKS